MSLILKREGLVFSGPPDAKVMFVGEALGYEEKRHGLPLVGKSGNEFTSMCSEAGISRSTAFITNVLHDMAPGGKIEFAYAKTKTQAKKDGIQEVDGRYPKEELAEGRKIVREIIEYVDPDIIVPLGDTALWAITGKSGITKWRGSIMSVNGRKVIPTFNPANIDRNWGNRWISVQDFRRVKAQMQVGREIRQPDWNFKIEPTFDEVAEFLLKIKSGVIVCDIEHFHGGIGCVGIAIDKLTAICVPLACYSKKDYNYWSLEDEAAIIKMFWEIFNNPNVTVIFHHSLSDCDFFARFWGFIPLNIKDTMIMQHAAFPGLRKALDFISSLYCTYYLYWKDDGKEWNPLIHTEEQHWTYNCTDCVYTYECYEILQDVIASYKLKKQNEFLHKLIRPVLSMMRKGILIDEKKRGNIGGELLVGLSERNYWFEEALGHPLNPSSNHPNGQMRKLFYHDFALKPVISRKTKKPSLDDDSLEILIKRSPLFRPLIEKIQEFRSLRVFNSNFVKAELTDGRMTASVNICGTHTYRFAYSKDNWEKGVNLQTIPEGSEDD